MKFFNKKILSLLLMFSVPFLFSGCKTQDKNISSKKLSVVCTNFPEYDFVKHIVKDRANVTMLLKPGAESHSFEPSPKDIINVKKSDMFVYVGGDSDEWVKKVLSSMNKDKKHIFKLMDAVHLFEEEHVEGMEEEKEEETNSKNDKAKKSEQEEEPEMDEHVWTSPKNAISIIKSMDKRLSSLDSKNKDFFHKNASSYIKEIEKLDSEIKNVIEHSKRKEIIVADRFPFLYFCREYGLKYYAAFPGCSKDTDASAKTIAFLVNKVKTDKIPIIFHIELSNEKICDSICEVTHAKKRLLNAIHNVTKEEFDKNVTYVTLMEHNKEVLKEALN